jgi:hypothetical protein
MKGSNRRRYFTEAELGKLISAARKADDLTCLPFAESRKSRH